MNFDTVTKSAVKPPAATALLLSDDPDAVEIVVESLGLLAIRARVASDDSAAMELLNGRKFEAVIVDADLRGGCDRILARLRTSTANRTAISFLIASRLTESAALRRTTFCLHRPLSPESVANTFRAAYGLILRERRRYFRCPIDAAGYVLGRNGQEVTCRVVNISEGGLALYAPSAPDWGFAKVRFTLPGHPGQFLAETKLRWHRDNGEVGLEFIFVSQKAEIQEWLARRLDDELPDGAAQFLRQSGGRDR